MSDYYSQGSTQECVLYAYRNGADYYLSVFQSHWQGSVPTHGPLDATAFQQEVGRAGFSAGVQSQILALNSGESFVFSDFGYPESFAQAWGMQLHDGDMPDESNEIVFTRVSAPNAELVVQVLLNSRNRGIADWKKLKKCLEGYTPSPGGSAGYDKNQLNQIQQELKSTGKSTVAPMNGSEMAIVKCVADNAVPLPTS